MFFAVFRDKMREGEIDRVQDHGEKEGSMGKVSGRTAVEGEDKGRGRDSRDGRRKKRH
jgi:hypothetical protein